MSTSIPRPEYPRPDLVRDDWFNLNGEWQFAFDDGNVGLREGWHTGRDFPQHINVPFAYQAPLSGIHSRDFHHVVWYRRKFEVPSGWYGRRVRLNFGACDFDTWVYVNGKIAMVHRGGHTPFSADITPLLALDNHNEIVVRVYDDERMAQPRGKQNWEYASSGICYTRTTGIWQTVWLEPVGDVGIERLRVNSWDLSGHVTVDVFLDHAGSGVRVKAEATWANTVVATAEEGAMGGNPASWTSRCVRLHLQVPTPQWWSVERPNLYGLNLTVQRNGEPVDRVRSYFGIRNITIAQGVILLNGHGLYQRLVLDQGYWPEGLLTAPSDDALKNDILWMKEMGFNGCRKHMKVEDPRFLYWADTLGYLVWGEMPAAFDFSDTAVRYFTAEWEEAVIRDRNHPCIITWTPINESWGVSEATVFNSPEQMAYLDGLYYLTRALDATRPVNGNDGWQNPKTDLTTIHDYTQDGPALRKRLETYIQTPTHALFDHNLLQHLPGHPFAGQPILVTEYGGIGLVTEAGAWGYGNAAHNADELLQRYDAVTGAIQSVPQCTGFCYTQLSDVEQEQNGLYTYDRKPKLDPKKVREINERRRKV
jgi:beta-galactosidase/beta-glucuronidase